MGKTLSNIITKKPIDGYRWIHGQRIINYYNEKLYLENHYDNLTDVQKKRLELVKSWLNINDK